MFILFSGIFFVILASGWDSPRVSLQRISKNASQVYNQEGGFPLFLVLTIIPLRDSLGDS